MRLGIRRIRSAGKASGSIEVTLPPELSALENISCRVLVRDGARPEIVLQPELTPAALVFGRIWSRFRNLLVLAGDIGEFPASEVDAVLLPTAETQPNSTARPTLVYAYALQIGREAISNWPTNGADFTMKASAHERSIDFDRVLVGAVRPLAIVAGRRLGLYGTFALAWGQTLVTLAVSDSAAVLDTGEMSAGGADGQYELLSARRIWSEVCGRDASPLCCLGAQAHDPVAQVALQRIVSQFRAWQEHPETHRAARVGRQTPAWFQGATQPSTER